MELAIIGLTWDPAGALAWQVTAQTHVEADASNSEYAEVGQVDSVHLWPAPFARLIE